MLDHVGLFASPSQFESIVEWYLTALAPLGYTKHYDFPGQAVGLGISKEDSPFWIGSKEGVTGGLHVAFRAKDHDTVDKFHEVAVKAGGTCNGEPGLRPHYGPTYYAAFVRDPLG
jgi:hypothetical protein